MTCISEAMSEIHIPYKSEATFDHVTSGMYSTYV